MYLSRKLHDIIVLQQQLYEPDRKLNRMNTGIILLKTCTFRFYEERVV